jgi:hypothetical protein
LFGITGSLTPNSTKLSPLSAKNSNTVKKNFIQNLIKTSNQRSSETNCENSNLLFQEINSNRCCAKNCISEFTSSEKETIVQYFKKLSNDHNRENDYLKGLVIPVPIKRRNTNTENDNKKPKSQSFEYFVETKNVRKKVCKNSFILHKIKKSRLVSKILKNRDISNDLRGKHGDNWNCLPQEVLDDVLDFIDNLPARESHYSPKSEKNRKYLSSDMNVAKLYRKFIDLYNEYEKVVSYGFFLHYFKKSSIGFGFPRSDICGE